MDNRLEIKYINIKDIKPYENNPRNNENAIPYVMESIKKFGFKNPVILDKNNIIVCGHTRIEAAQKLGLKEVPVIYADDLTDEQIKAFRIADNKVSEFSTWDLDKLDLELEDINIDMSDFGILDFNIEEDEEEINISDNRELDTEDYNDENFDIVCPKCGFRFNEKE